MQGQEVPLGVFECGLLSTLPNFRAKGVEDNRKLIVPDPIATILTSFGNVTYPVCFKLTNKEKKSTYCALYDYSLYDKIFLPTSVMQKLDLEAGDAVEMDFVNLPKATAVFVQKQYGELIENADLKEAVQNALWKYVCLNEGDIFTVNLNGTIHNMMIKKIFPNSHAHISKPFVVPIKFVEPSVTENASTSFYMTD